MIEGGGDGFEIGTDWGAGMGGGVDRDRHGGGMSGLNGFFFLVVQLGKGMMLNICLQIVFVKISWRKVDFLRAGSCGELPRAVAYNFSLAYLLPALVLCQGAYSFTETRICRKWLLMADIHCSSSLVPSTRLSISKTVDR